MHNIASEFSYPKKSIMEYFWQFFFAVLQFSIICLTVHFSEKVKTINIHTSQDDKLRLWKTVCVYGCESESWWWHKDI